MQSVKKCWGRWESVGGDVEHTRKSGGCAGVGKCWEKSVKVCSSVGIPAIGLTKHHKELHGTENSAKNYTELQEILSNELQSS